MALRIRRAENHLIALCAVESDPKEGDIYLDDEVHYALSMHYMRLDGKNTGDYARLQDSQKVRDAKEVYRKWQHEPRSI